MVEAEEVTDVSGDYIAARVDAFTQLMVTVEATKDKKLHEEGMLMLRAVRMSFKTIPQGQVTAIRSQEVGRPL